MVQAYMDELHLCAKLISIANTRSFCTFLPTVDTKCVLRTQYRDLISKKRKNKQPHYITICFMSLLYSMRP